MTELTADHRGARSGLLRRAIGLGRSLAWAGLGALLATILATGARLLGPIAVRVGVDDGIGAGDKGIIARAALAFATLILVQYVAQRISQFAVAWLGERYLLILRSRLFAHLIRLDMGFYGRAKAGVLVSRMTNDIESLTEYVEEGAVITVTNLITVIGVAIVMAIVDPQLAVTILALVGLVTVLSLVFQRYAGRAYREVREHIGRVLAGLQEGITGVRVVQAFTREERQALIFGGMNERYFEASMRAARAVAWYFPTVAFFRVVAIGTVLLVGGRQVVAGDLTFGTLVAFLFYLEWFFQPIVNLSHVYNQLQSAIAALGRIFDLLDTRPAITSPVRPVALPWPVRGELRLEAVSFAYEPSVPVLHGLDLVVSPGERIAIVGETGAGKSTIAKLALRFHDPTAGSVRLDGVDLRRLSHRDRTAAISLIPQEGFLFAGTLRDNLRYARPEITDAEIWEVCRVMGLEEWIRSLPERLDMEVRERGARLSAGEKQLVALARALIANPAVIVLDEATANLDPNTEVRVERALAAVLQGRTTIVIAHRLRTAERADRVVMVDRGRIIAEGRHGELLETSPQYARLVEVWRRGALV